MTKKELEKEISVKLVDIAVAAKNEPNHVPIPRTFGEIMILIDQYVVGIIGEDEDTAYPGFSPDEVSPLFTEGWYRAKGNRNELRAEQRKKAELT